MRNIMLRRGTSTILAITFLACSGCAKKTSNTNELTNSYVEEENTELEDAKKDKKIEVKTIATHNNLTLPNLEDAKLVDISESFSLCAEEPIPNSVGSYEFHYAPGYNVYLYDKIVFNDKMYRIIDIDGVKYLVDATSYEVYISGFEELGEPFYLKYYDPQNGGKDSIDGNSGYILPFTDKEGKVYMVDIDTFEILLYGIDPTIKKEYYDYGIYRPFTATSSEWRQAFEYWHLGCIEGYSSRNSDSEKDNKFGDYVVCIYKDGVNYLVETTDFTKIVAENYEEVKWYTDSNGLYKLVITGKDGKTTVHNAKDFEPKESKVLTYKFQK